MTCPRCGDDGWICETHPDSPYPHLECTDPRIPCPVCNTSDPPRNSEAFVSYITPNAGDTRGQQRALLHGAPQPPARQPKPGELLMTFERGQDVFRVELRDFQPNGVETQILQNGVLLSACRFTVRPIAVVWAEQQRTKILKTR